MGPGGPRLTAIYALVARQKAFGEVEATIEPYRPCVRCMCAFRPGAAENGEHRPTSSGHTLKANTKLTTSMPPLYPLGAQEGRGALHV